MKNIQKLKILLVTLILVSVFPIASANEAPSINIISPNDGDILIGTFSIEYGTFDPDVGDVLTVILDVSNDGGITWHYPQTYISGDSLDSTTIPDGEYIGRLTVTDSGGLSSSDEVIVYVENVNELPTIIITSPSDDAIITGTFSIEYGTSDPDVGDVLTVILDVSNDGGITWHYPQTYISGDSLDSTTIPDGEYIGRLTVTDSSGSSSSDEVKVYVNNEDLDGDGYTSLIDCNDSDANVNPGAVEVCNGIDDNCDGDIDEGVLTIYFQDLDGDGYGNTFITQEGCSVPAGYIDNGNHDCDDSNSAINPGAVEINDNGIDENCDGIFGVTPSINIISPNDGDIITGIFSINYETSDPDVGDVLTVILDISNDGGTTWHYPQTYISGDSLDSTTIPDGEYIGRLTVTDSSGSSSSDEVKVYVNNEDLDGDGYTSLIDCNDSDPSVYPGALEICDGKANDCNDKTKADGSGEAAPQNTNQAGVCALSTKVCSGGIWTDSYSGIAGYEAAETSCDGLDNNCDGMVDENLTRPYYTGPTGTNNIGICIVGIETCSAGIWNVSTSEVIPASEICGNGIDDNCDGTVDEGCNAGGNDDTTTGGGGGGGGGGAYAPFVGGPTTPTAPIAPTNPVAPTIGAEGAVAPTGAEGAAPPITGAAVAPITGAAVGAGSTSGKAVAAVSWLAALMLLGVIILGHLKKRKSE